MMTTLGIVIKGDDKNLTGKPLMKRTMQLWINAADTLLQMLVTKLPSPRVAQKYRVENLYEGPMDDTAAKAIMACDPKGPLMMYVSKMVPTSDKGRFHAFGRVFSGTIATGMRVRIQGPFYKPGGKEDLHQKNIQRTVLMMGRSVEQIADVPCGNTVALVGVDQYLLKSGTITDIDDAHNITAMKYSVSPVVKVAVKPKDGKDLPKLVEGLKKLSKSDPLVVCTTEESGEHVIAGCGELHVEICLKDLREEYAQCDFTVGDPVVSYRETVTCESSQTCLAKSPNKHNRLYVNAVPLADELGTAIEDGPLGPKADIKERVKLLKDSYEWKDDEARKIWAWGPETEGANLVVDQTLAVQYLLEIKEHVNSAFQWISKEGPLCEENMRGVRFNLMDVKLHADSIHRGMGQIQPTARRVFYASLLTTMPRFQEPIFRCDIVAPEDQVAGVRQALAAKRGELNTEETAGGKVTVSGYLPVAETIGEDPFSKVLQTRTSGKAFPAYSFDHWKLIQADPLKGPKMVGGKKVADGSKAYDMMLGIRQ